MERTANPSYRQRERKMYMCIYPVWQSHILTSNLPCPPKECGNWIKTPWQGQGPAKMTMLGLTLIRLKVRCWRAAAWWFSAVPDSSSGHTCEEMSPWWIGQVSLFRCDWKTLPGISLYIHEIGKFPATFFFPPSYIRAASMTGAPDSTSCSHSRSRDGKDAEAVWNDWDRRCLTRPSLRSCP